jgi:hypothetical protein
MKANEHPKANMQWISSEMLLGLDGLHLPRMEYQNHPHSEPLMIRHPIHINDNVQSTLEHTGLIVHSKYNIQDISKPRHCNRFSLFIRSRVLLPVNFFLDYVIRSDDYATFSTDVDKMPLLVLIGITNTNLLFPTFYAFRHSVLTDTYNRILRSLNELTFSSHASRPGVILDDKSGEMMASSFKCCPVMLYQICEWHKAESLPKYHINTARYDTTNCCESKAIYDAIWKYIH